jgi:hypothetical protein
MLASKLRTHRIGVAPPNTAAPVLRASGAVPVSIMAEFSIALWARPLAEPFVDKFVAH